MKQLHYFFFATLAMASACSTDKKTAETGDAIKTDTIAPLQTVAYNVNLDSSAIHWIASEGLAFNLEHGHNGTFNISKGTLHVGDSTLQGSFEIDIKSLKVLDIKKEASNKKLVGHLLNADFFDADKFPTATFEIVSAKPLPSDSTEVTGNLTLKGVTKSVVIPAKVDKTDSTVTANAKFYINRKDWNMHYRTEESLGDELIRPEVLIELAVRAKK